MTNLKTKMTRRRTTTSPY